MSKEEENIDKLIKAKLANRDFGTPPEEFINDLNSRLDKANKSPFGPKLFTLLSILLLGSFLFFLLTPTQYKLSFHHKQNLINKTTHNTHSKNKDKETIDSKEQAIGLDATSSNNEHNLDNTNSKTKVGSAPDIENEIESPLSESKDNIDLLHTERKNEVKSNSVEINLEPNSTATKTLQNIDKKEVKDSEEKPDFSDFTKLVRNKNKGSYRMITAIEFPLIDDKINDWDFFTLKSSPPISSPKLDSTISKKPETKKKFNYEVQIYAGVGFDQARINNTISDKYATKLNLQSENEVSPLFGVQFNLVYKNLVFGSGLTFSQQREDNDFKLESTINTDSVYISYYDYEYDYDSLNNPYDSTLVPVYDTTQITSEQLNEFKIEQNYSWLQIPIHFGYRFQLNKWAITPSLGINLAIGIKTKQMRYPNQTFDQFESFSPMKWHMNVQGNIEIRRNINRWHVFAIGGFNYGISPVLKSSLFHRKYNGINCALGVGYSF